MSAWPGLLRTATLLTADPAAAGALAEAALVRTRRSRARDGDPDRAAARREGARRALLTMPATPGARLGKSGCAGPTPIRRTSWSRCSRAIVPSAPAARAARPDGRGRARRGRRCRRPRDPPAHGRARGGGRRRRAAGPRRPTAWSNSTWATRPWTMPRREPTSHRWTRCSRPTWPSATCVRPSPGSTGRRRWAATSSAVSTWPWRSTGGPTAVAPSRPPASRPPPSPRPPARSARTPAPRPSGCSSRGSVSPRPRCTPPCSTAT